jgi:lambda family phage portal protein
MVKNLSRFWNGVKGKFTSSRNELPENEYVSIVKNSEPVNLSSGGFTWDLISSLFDGSKYPGGLGGIQADVWGIDYWTLRRRSYKLFTENRYAAGLIKRLVTNIIHRGLTLEATPNGSILGQEDDFINDWTDDVEAKFEIWGENKELVSYNHQFTFGQQQENIYKTALLSGDCLIILRQHPVLRTPTIEVLDGVHVRSPLNKKTANEIRHGVEIDKKGRHLAYYVTDGSDPTGLKRIRIPARGSKSGRRIAWLYYGHKIRVDDIRGMPALGIIMQALKELDRYSDAEQRAAVLNAILAMMVTKKEDKIGSRPLRGGALRRDSVDVSASSSGSSSPRTWNINRFIPGMIIDELQQGEEPVSFNTVRPNVNYRVFEEAMMATFAWVMEMPPNIYRLAFSSNYSASGAEINEFKIFLDKLRGNFASDVDKPVYKEWLISMVLAGLIQAEGLLESWRDTSKFLISGAWFQSEWSGAIKPSLRRINDIKGYIAAIKEGLATRDMATKEIYGRKYTTIVKRLKKENASLVSSLEPLTDAGLISTQSTTQIESD